VNPVNEHGDMIAISAYRKMEADLYDQIYDLQFENAGLRVELEQQAIVNGKGSEREAALLAKLEQLKRETAALREQVDDWENAVLHARDNRSQEQHCTCVAPLVGKVKQLEREKALQGLHLATMADVVLGENANDRSDETLVREVCRMAREHAARKEQP
jgi:hypothetical protein